MRNESLNNTCILFDPKNEAQQKAIIKFYNDNGWEMLSLTDRLMADQVIGVYDHQFAFWLSTYTMQVIELPSDYYPTKIVESESKSDTKWKRIWKSILLIKAR